MLASYQRDETASSQQFLPVAATLHAPAGRKLDPSTFLGDKDFDKLDARVASATVLFDHAFNDIVTWRSDLRYIDSKTDFREIFPDTYSNPDRSVQRGRHAQSPHLRREARRSHPHRRQLAAIRFRHRQLPPCRAGGRRLHGFPRGVLHFLRRDHAHRPYNPVSTGVVVPEYNLLPDQRSTQVGLYAQDQIRWADRVTVVLGARRDRATSETQRLAEPDR